MAWKLDGACVIDQLVFFTVYRHINSLTFEGGFECFYEKVIKVKADVAALLNLFSDVSIDVPW
jgi:hypothetical protein